MIRFSVAVVATVLAVVCLLGSVAPLVAEGASLDSAEQDLVARINAFRAARSLPTLAVSDTLTSAAKWMSTDMGSRNYFAHTSLDGRSPTQRMADAGYPAFGTWTGLGFYGLVLILACVFLSACAAFANFTIQAVR